MAEWKIWAMVWLLVLGALVGGVCLGRTLVEPKPCLCDCSEYRERVIKSSTKTCATLLRTMSELKKRELCQ